MSRLRAVLLLTLSALAPCLWTGASRADEVRFHLNGEVARTVIDPQQREFGWGGGGAVAIELPLGKVLGLQVEGGGLYLPRDKAPADVRIADHGDGSAWTGMIGLRLRPFGAIAPGGLWLDANGGYVRTGDANRAGFDAHLGYDFRIGKGRFDIGPFVGYLHVLQPDDTLRPEDAHVLLGGIHIALGARAPTKPGQGDRDRDGIHDGEDACPDVAGVRTQDPATNGCPPPDRDRDGITDADDACPDSPGPRTSDPRTNGCPPDRDKDGVADEKDACPDQPGIATNDPKTNGCPADRDQDGVLDAVDACPEVPGVRTEDPKTNGCPAATESVHVEKDHIILDDKIYFETDIARVRHYSWPLVMKLAKFLNANPDMVEISIEGHTDEVGSDEYNMDLSRGRAESVKKLLVKFGVDEKRLSTQGWGKTRPVVEGHGEEAHKRNRRVEFIITRSRPAGGAAAPLPGTSIGEGR